MANLQIKGMDDDLYAAIKEMAVSENRSVSQQVLFLIKQYLANRKQISKCNSPAQVLLNLAGSWEDPRSAEQIVDEIRDARKNSTRLREGW